MRIISLIIILCLAAFLRLYQLPELARFGYDEGRDARIVREMIVDQNLTLLGPETRIGDKIIYFGPLHYYLMVPALYFSKFDPMSGYFLTALLGVLTVFIIYLLTKSIKGSAFYAVFPIAVFYNRWAWNPNTIPLFSALSLLFLKKKSYILAGLFIGLTFQLHVTTAFLFLVAAIWMLKDKRPPKDYAYLALGSIIGVLPMLIFDLKHDFLYAKSLIGLKDMVSGSREITWHYFLWVLPLLAILVAKLPKKLGTTLVAISFSITLYLLLNLKPDPIQNPKQVELVSKLISSDQKSTNLPFNIASFVDGDARATPYRFFLERNGVKPLGYSEYSVSDHIYVLTFDDPTEVLYNDTYEISSFKPKSVSKSWKQGEVNIFRLER